MDEITDENLAELNAQITGKPIKQKKKRRFSLLFYILVVFLLITTAMSIIAFKATEKQLGWSTSSLPFHLYK
jgi:hypothetical protein